MPYIVGIFRCRTLVSVLIGLGILLFSIVPRAAFADMLPPRSMDELLNKVTLVVIGEIGSVVRCIDIPSGSTQVPFDCFNPPSSVGHTGLIFTVFQLDVKEVILDDGTVAAATPINVMILGLPIEQVIQASQNTETPFSRPGDRHLFLLTPSAEEDALYSVSFGTWGRLIIDGEILRISNGEQWPLRFAEYGDDPITLEQFKQILASRRAHGLEDEQVQVPLNPNSPVSSATDSAQVKSFIDMLMRTVTAIWQRFAAVPNP